VNKDFWRYVAGALFTFAFISTVVTLIFSSGDKTALTTVVIVMTGALILIAILPKVQGFTIGLQGVEARLGQAENAIREQKEEVKTLNSKVKQIEEKINFEPSTALTPNLEQELNSSLSSFRAYLQELGFEPPEEGQVSVRVEPKPEFSGSFYDPLSHRIVVSEDFASDKDFALREYTNHALLLIVKVDVVEMSTACQEFESGLAYYFPCSFKDNPLFAPVLAKKFPEHYIWGLNNNQKFTKLRSSFRINGDLQGEIWGAAFWEMRELLGQAPADKLLFNTWSALQPSDVSNKKRIHFAKRLLEIAAYGGGNHVSRIQAIFERRGLKFSDQ